MNNIDFYEELSTRLNKNNSDRPFVCDGNPLECSIFIVGFNPATEMTATFREFWNVESGFDKKTWLDAYIQERESKPFKPGKSRRNKLSNTRQRIEWILNSISEIKCLETNLYMTPTVEAKELTRSQKDASIFNFLLETVKPKSILVHGVEAKKHLESLTDDKKTLKLEVFSEVMINGHKVSIYPITHLSRGWSKQKCFSLGTTLSQYILAKNLT